MTHKTGYIYNPEHDEYYIPEEAQCERCANEAVEDGLCNDCQQEAEEPHYGGSFWTTEALGGDN